MIPTFNQSKFILRAIESALNQTYSNLEIVVSDDCSTDTTYEIIKKYSDSIKDTRLKVFQNKSNIGRLRNYSETLEKKITGDWVINLDGDDFFINDCFISEAMSVIQNKPSVVLIYGNYVEYFIDSQKKIEQLNLGVPQFMNREKFFDLYANGKILWNHNSILYKRNIALEVGFYWHINKAMNDWESFLRLIIAGKNVAYINKNSAAWVQHDNNITQKVNIEKYLNNFELIEGVADFANQNSMQKDFINRWKKLMLIRSAKNSCIAFIKNKQIILMFKFLYRAKSLNLNSRIRLLFNLGLWIRFFGSLNPNLYRFLKGLKYKYKLKMKNEKK